MPLPDFHSFALFLAAALLLLVMPGPAVLYVVARSLDGGRRAGLVSTFGLGLGNVVHVAAAALGLSAILLTSAVAFQAVKLAGAAYLIYLGLRRLLGNGNGGAGIADDAASGGTAPRALFVQGVIVNLLNPKSALFFFAFLPQFVDPARGAVAAQMAFLGLVFVALGVATDALWAVAAGGAGRWLRGRPAVLRAERWIGGGTLVGLGVATAVAGGKD